MRTKELEMRIKKLEGEMEELAWMASSLRMKSEGVIEELEREIADNAKKLEQELFDKYDKDELTEDIFMYIEGEVYNYTSKKDKEMFTVHKELFENDVIYTELEFDIRHQIDYDFYKIKNEYYENTEEKLDELEKNIRQMSEKLEKYLEYENSK